MINCFFGSLHSKNFVAEKYSSLTKNEKRQYAIYRFSAYKQKTSAYKQRLCANE